LLESGHNRHHNMPAFAKLQRISYVVKRIGHCTVNNASGCERNVNCNAVISNATTYLIIQEIYAAVTIFIQ
jgi:hypothetical protein